jgi:antibiotic biosynthesis monooxygenase (ABM) superfamily enzyme
MSANESTVFMVRHRVSSGAEARYEAWLEKIVPKAATYPGHQGTHVVRPSVVGGEYVFMLRFATPDDARTWIESEDRRRLVAEVSDIIAKDETLVRPGIDFWFTLPAEKRPPAWKQWLITTAVIAPLTMVVPAVYAPLFDAVPWLSTYGVRHVLVAATIVALVTFLIMPRLVRALRRWLYA